jgi:magnesium-transporting ATPase (P-type)
VVLLLVVAAALALAVGDPLDSAAIAVVLLVNTALGFVVELRARRTMEATTVFLTRSLRNPLETRHHAAAEPRRRVSPKSRAA